MISDSIQQLWGLIESITIWVQQMESKITALEDQIMANETVVSASHNVLSSHISWLESFTHWFNLCVLGLSEKLEKTGQQKLVEFMGKFSPWTFKASIWFAVVLGFLELAYGIPRVLSSTNKPSPVTVKFLRMSIKDNLLHLARQKENLWRGSKWYQRYSSAMSQVLKSTLSCKKYESAILH